MRFLITAPLIRQAPASDRPLDGVIFTALHAVQRRNVPGRGARSLGRAESWPQRCMRWHIEGKRTVLDGPVESKNCRAFY